MKTFQHIRILRIALIFAAITSFCACNDLELETENPQFSDPSTSNITGITDQGTEYLGRNFFLSNVDQIETIATTRSTEPEPKLTRNFNVMAKASGANHLGVHVMAAFIDENQSLQQIGVLVNDEYVGELDIKKAEWDFVTLKDGKTINLQPGNNKITFTASPPYYPEIDAIQIEKNAQALMMDDPQYKDFITQLSIKRPSSMEKLEQEIINENEISDKSDNAATRSAWDPSWNWQVTPQTLSNPDGNYQHKIKVPVTYTYHRKLSLAKGSYTFITGPIAGDDYYSCDPVMYLYKIDDPHNYSYYNDDYSGMGWHSRITASLPAGDYYLVIRAYNSYYASTSTGRQGLINVYQNGNLLNSQCPIAGYSVDVDSPNTGLINYFTAYSTGLPEFFLEEKGGNKAKFFGQMNFYASPMEHMWWDDARLMLNKPSSSARYRMIITAVGAFGAYYGNCDVYGSCQQVQTGSLITNAFPNLKVNDAIYSSASETDVYNCSSWAGGLTYGWTWGGIYKNKYNGTLVGPYYGSPQVWSSWDSFFANNPQRYAGATVYTRENANSSNGEIAVWSTNGSISEVTHFSVRGTANNHPHGYAWESKPGTFRRIFHPRDALRGLGYGSIIAYYRDASKDPYGEYSYSSTRSANIKNKSISLEESIQKGLTVIEKVELTPQQKELFSAKSSTRAGSAFTTSEIKKRYDIWVNRISQPDMAIHSDPNILINNQEGNEFIGYCSKNKKDALAFFIDLYFNQTEENAPKLISYYMFCDIFEEYATIIEKIKNDWKNNQYNSNGAYIAPTPEMFLKKYAKELINKII